MSSRAELDVYGGVGLSRPCKLQPVLRLVWAPKYRRNVLDGKIGKRAKQIIMDVSAKYGYKIDTLKVLPDHIHLLISLPPRISVVEALGR